MILPYNFPYNQGTYIVWINYKCDYYESLVWSVKRHGHIVGFTYRCWECFNCSWFYESRFLAKFWVRYDNFNTRGLYLWTFGTSLKIDELDKFKVMWRKFTRQMSTYCKRDDLGFNYSPLVYVIEVGSVGKRLHIHCLFDEYFRHSYVIKKWRKLTGEKSNVHFVPKETDRKKVYYIVKYIAKDNPPIWLGRYRCTIKTHRKGKECTICNQLFVLPKKAVYEW